MPFVKTVKTKAYFKRFQVKYRRRREGKTDYYARTRLVVQDKNKYQMPKHRLVVRFTNTAVICQIVRSEIAGDVVVESAYSSELPKFGLPVGLKNYAAAYCTGLLLARRLLTKLNLADEYKGAEEVTGEIPEVEDENEVTKRSRTFFVSELDEEKRPFRCYLDVGIRRTTRGARLFGALKGASDGGLDIPHNPKRFPGYDAESGEYDASVHREKIFGGHVRDYMNTLAEEDPDAYAKHFSKFIEKDISGDDLEELYAKVHAAIRENPTRSAKPASTIRTPAGCRKQKRRSASQRYNRVQQKMKSRAQKLAAQIAAMED